MVAGVNITVPLRFGGANVSHRLALDVFRLCVAMTAVPSYVYGGPEGTK